MPEMQANAHLIAAAPDLLAALQGLAMFEDRVLGAQGGDIILRIPDGRDHCCCGRHRQGHRMTDHRTTPLEAALYALVVIFGVWERLL